MASIFPQGIQFVSALKTLGVYIHPPNDVAQRLYTEKFKKQVHFLNSVEIVNHAQAEHLLLQLCGPFPRSVYLMRNCPPHEISDFLKNIDSEMEIAIAHFLGRTPSVLELAQLRLKITLAGFGFRSTVAHHPAALISCIVQVRPLVRMILNIGPDEDIPVLSEMLDTAITAFNELVAPDHHILDPDSLTPEIHTQKKLSGKIDKFKLAQLKEAHVIDHDLHCARLNELSQKNAGAWLSAPLGWTHRQSGLLRNCPGLSSKEFRVAASLRLGYQFFPSDQICDFPEHTGNVDVTKRRPHDTGVGCHNLFACKAKGHAIKAHDAQKVCFNGLAEFGNVHTQLEPQVREPPHPQARGDVAFLNFDGGRTTVIDISLVDPLGNASLAKTIRKGGTGPASRELTKKDKYREIFTAERGYEFVPFGISYYGSFGPHAVGIIQRIGIRIARAHDVDPPIAFKMIYVDLSLTLQAYLARCITTRVHFPTNRLDVQVPIEHGRNVA